MKIVATVLLLMGILFSCSDKAEKKIFADGGGVFKMCISEAPSTTIPRNVTDVHSATVINQVMEGLVSFNPEDMSVVPQLASSWKVSKDEMTYEFTLRSDVLFHACEVLSSESDRLLTMDDVIHSFELACRQDPNGNPTPAYTSFFQGTIRGLDEFHKGKAKHISGLKAKGNMLTISLVQPDANFLNKLANVNAAIGSKKVYEAKKEYLMVGTGPFVYSGITEGEPARIKLKKNEDYYLTDKQGNALPYLDEIEFIIEKKQLDELELFESGETQFITSLPSSRTSSMLAERMKDFNSVPPLMILRNNPLLATNFYFFNMKDKRFKDVRVRQAFNYAINRDKITQMVLRGQAYENGVYGVVPPISSTFRGYDFKGVREVSYDYNPDTAKRLLAEAGFPGGKGFGSVNLRLNVGDEHSAVAEEVAFQIFQNLGINVNIDATSFDQKNADADYLKGDLFRMAWFADYISPESFLINFYGKIVPKSMNEPSVINQSRYTNPAFDNLFEQAKKQDKLAERLAMFAEAEKELMKDPPLIPLWYNGDIQLVYSKVRNFHENPLNYFVFREVYFKEWTKAEYENRIKSE